MFVARQGSPFLSLSTIPRRDAKVLGSISTIMQLPAYFCLSPESGVIADMLAPTLRATSGPGAAQQKGILFDDLVGAREQRRRDR
jgi:hypothetical protein